MKTYKKYLTDAKVISLAQVKKRKKEEREERTQQEMAEVGAIVKMCGFWTDGLINKKELFDYIRKIVK